MSKKLNPAPDRTLAERTLDELLAVSRSTVDDLDVDARDEMLKVLNLAFLEAQADGGRMENVTPWELSVFPKRFWATVNGEQKVFFGEIPPVGTLYRTDEPNYPTYFVGSHKK